MRDVRAPVAPRDADNAPRRLPRRLGRIPGVRGGEYIQLLGRLIVLIVARVVVALRCVGREYVVCGRQPLALRQQDHVDHVAINRAVHCLAAAKQHRLLERVAAHGAFKEVVRTRVEEATVHGTGPHTRF